MERITYTTPGGTEITLEHVTSMGLEADHNLTRPCDYIAMTVQGRTYNALEIGRHESGQDVIQGFGGMRGVPCVVLPADPDVRAQVVAMFAGVTARVQAESERSTARAIREREEYAQMRRNGYCPRCHTYCHGDCTAD